MRLDNDKEFGVCVITRENEDIESLIRRFRKRVAKNEIIKTYKSKLEFLKPSKKKKKKRVEAQKRREKDLLKIQKKMSKRKGDFKNEYDSSK